jgi:DNA-binding NtrC family response regulator
MVTGEDDASASPPVPGVVVVFAGGKPKCVTISVDAGPLEIGRELLVDRDADDDAVSRTHAQIAFDGRRWSIRDLESRNGTFVDGERVRERVCERAPVIRLGRAILIAVADVTPFGHGIEHDKSMVIGATLRATYDAIALAARLGSTLHFVGESGSGKELAAQRFHASGPRASGRFVAVNCAAIPEGVAERLLFGATKGAFSGADANVDGYVQTADGGTLFLDEIAELDLAVQAKLLRVLETQEVLAFGAAKPRRVTFGICSATHRDLRAAVAEKTFREDLFFRVGRPDVTIPALRERREEIAWHVERAIASCAADLAIDAAFLEACLVRHWPGNVRELVAEVRQAAHKAIAQGRRSVIAECLAADAGRSIAQEASPARDVDRASVEAALRECDGNVTGAAKALGMHRNQLRRWIAKEGVDPSSFARHDESGE